MNWKKVFVIALDAVIATYLLLAITSFNKPESKAAVCAQVQINIDKNELDGFLNVDDIKKILDRKKLYPLGQPIDDVSTRNIEETLRQNPFVEEAQCYKTQGGSVCIRIVQRMPVMRIMAENGDNYYIDSRGNIMPNTQYASNVIIATGHITRKYAQQTLTAIGNLVVYDKFWQSEMVQLNVLGDGSLEMVPRVGEHIVYFGKPTDIQKKLTRLEKFYKYGLSQAGWNKYSYINLEFSNQIICKRRSAKHPS